MVEFTYALVIRSWNFFIAPYPPQVATEPIAEGPGWRTRRQPTGHPTSAHTQPWVRLTVTYSAHWGSLFPLDLYGISHEELQIDVPNILYHHRKPSMEPLPPQSFYNVDRWCTKCIQSTAVFIENQPTFSHNIYFYFFQSRNQSTSLCKPVIIYINVLTCALYAWWRDWSMKPQHVFI